MRATYFAPTTAATPGASCKRCMVSQFARLAMAPSDPNLLVIGALDGVFRSKDGGQTWERISPDNNAEIKDIESLAIDPQNPDIIYPGSGHLPWKTDNGGASWHSISKGIAFDWNMFQRHFCRTPAPRRRVRQRVLRYVQELNKAEYFHRIYLSVAGSGTPHSRP